MALHHIKNFVGNFIEKLKRPAEYTDYDDNLIDVENADRNLIISSVSLGVGTLGELFYPPLTLVTIPVLAYLAIPILKKAYKEVVIKRRITVEVPLLIAIAGIIIAGYYLIASLAFWLYILSEKILCKVQDNAIKSLTDVFSDQPRFVWTIKDNGEFEVPFDTLKANDILVVNAGGTIAADGTIIEGTAMVDQHILTGESKALEKYAGEHVFACTVVLSGRILIEVEKSGNDTVAAQIGNTLNNTIDYKMAKEIEGVTIANKLSIVTLALAALALNFRGYVGSFAVLCTGLGEDMRLLAPLSLLNFLRIASRHGLLIKDGRSLEILKDVDTVVFDKTGTLTLEQPVVWKIHSSTGYDKREVLQYAAWAEHRHTHPIAQAILEKAHEYELDLSAMDSAIYEVGFGIKGKIADSQILVGSARFMEMEGIIIRPEIDKVMQECHEYGHSLIMVAKDHKLAGAIELHIATRPEVKEIIHELKERNMKIYILSGDHEQPTRTLARDLEVDHYFAEVFPEQKSNIIEQLQDEGKTVCFIGDGINDTIAMKKSQVSVSLRGASTVATDTAEIILLDGNLTQVGKLFKISHTISKNVNVAMATAIIPTIINISGVFFSTQAFCLRS